MLTICTVNRQGNLGILIVSGISSGILCLYICLGSAHFQFFFCVRIRPFPAPGQFYIPHLFTGIRCVNGTIYPCGIEGRIRCLADRQGCGSRHGFIKGSVFRGKDKFIGLSVPVLQIIQCFRRILPGKGAGYLGSCQCAGITCTSPAIPVDGFSTGRVLVVEIVPMGIRLRGGGLHGNIGNCLLHGQSHGSLHRIVVCGIVRGKDNPVAAGSHCGDKVHFHPAPASGKGFSIHAIHRAGVRAAVQHSVADRLRAVIQRLRLRYANHIGVCLVDDNLHIAAVLCILLMIRGELPLGSLLSGCRFVIRYTPCQGSRHLIPFLIHKVHLFKVQTG